MRNSMCVTRSPRGQSSWLPKKAYDPDGERAGGRGEPFRLADAAARRLGDAGGNGLAPVG